jgi:hypothetical protein
MALTVDTEKRKRSEEASASKAGYDSVDAWKNARREEEAAKAGFESGEAYAEHIAAGGRATEGMRSGTQAEKAAAKAEGERLMREREFFKKRKEAEEEAFLDPAMQEKRRELQRRTKQSVMLGKEEGRQIQDWEREARKQADLQRDQMLGRARAMGLSAAQMEALNQGLQQTDVEFERQVRQMRFRDKEAAEEELTAFEQAAKEQGAQSLMAQEQLEFQRKEAAASRSAGLWGSILSGVATLGAAALPILFSSDERIKSDIDRGKTKNAAYDFLDNLDVAQYNMPGANTPEMGVMAQSMEKSSLGQQAVTEVEGVKSVDVPQAFKSLIVAQKEMHDRIKRLEKK